MKTFMYFFEKANLQLNDDILNKFKLNFKKAEIELTPSNKGINSTSGIFIKLQGSETVVKYVKDEQTWNFIEEIDGTKLYIGWYNSEFDEIIKNLNKLKREDTNKHLKFFEYTGIDGNSYLIPLLLFLPRSLQYNNKGILEKAYSKRYYYLTEIADKYFKTMLDGSFTADSIDVYEDISILMNVFYHINKYDLLYSGIFDEMSVAEFFEKALTIDLLINALKEEQEAKDLVEKKS